MKHLGVWSLILLAGVGTAQAAITGQAVEYRAGKTVLKGYLAYDEGVAEKRPGVLVVHEWWGHNEYARKRARMLAELGYTALAVDMYGDGKQAAHPEDAGKFSTEVRQNMDNARARFVAAMDFLKRQKTVDPERIAAIGYCFGGSVVLDMARMGVDLDGVVSFHGSLSTSRPAKRGVVKAKVLACNGADDSFVSQAQIAQFKKEMKDAGVDFQFKSYKGAKHSFTNPDADTYGRQFNIPLAYSARADRASWSDMKKFLDQVLKK